MKLYTADMSPFAARVRLAVYAKGLDVEFVFPPAGLRSAEYRAVNPMGKIPALVLDDGVVIPESDTIIEYLEDVFPQKPLRPADPVLAARTRLVARVGDLYISAPMTGLFKQMMSKERDAAVTAYELARLKEGLVHLEAVMGGGAFAVGEAFTTADCHLIPVLHFLTVIERAFKEADLTADLPKTAAYRARITAHPLGKRAADEIDAGLAAFQKR
jgi:glutathione S-transferase